MSSSGGVETSTPSRSETHWPLLVAAIGANVLGTIPMFLLGAVYVFLRDEFGIDRSTLGVLTATYPAAVAVAAIPGGHLVNRIGARSVLVGGMGLIVAATLGLATLTQSSGTIMAFMLLGGLAQGGCAPATDVAVGEAVASRRQGIAYGMKQAAIPLGALLAGLSIPVIAVPFGWRWVFVLDALFGIAVVIVVARAPISGRRVATARARQPRAGTWTRSPILLLVAAGCGLGTAAGTAGSIFLVDSGVDAGLSAGVSGLLLGVAGGSGILGRLLSGWWVDRRQGNGLRGAALMLAGGASGYLLIATAELALFVPAALVAFGAGWGWGGLSRYGTLRIHSAAPGSAMGLLNAGIATGGVLGPIVFGHVAETGFTAAWLLAGLVCGIGALFVGLGNRWSPTVADVSVGLRPVDS